MARYAAQFRLDSRQLLEELNQAGLDEDFGKTFSELIDKYLADFHQEVGKWVNGWVGGWVGESINPSVSQSVNQSVSGWVGRSIQSVNQSRGSMSSSK